MASVPVPRIAVVALCMALLAACATAPKPTDTAFELTGRVAIRSGQEAASGRLFWRHGQSFDDLMISTPLGMGIAEITRRAELYTLTTSDTRRMSAADPETLTDQALGWRFPLAGLPDWVQGRPYSNSEGETQRGPDGRVQLIRQLGWTIEYLAYDDETELPSRMRLTREGLDIRLTIDDWAVVPK
ncbi:MAG: lipoprotein insertase outer membrane protein LolB [Burkholderiales bacterium]